MFLPFRMTESPFLMLGSSSDVLLVCVVLKSLPGSTEFRGLQFPAADPTSNMKHTSLTLALLSLTNISYAIAAKKNLIIDTDLFSDVE